VNDSTVPSRKWISASTGCFSHPMNASSCSENRG
jgi:hypothetical protein